MQGGGKETFVGAETEEACYLGNDWFFCQIDSGDSVKAIVLFVWQRGVWDVV